MMRGYRCTNKRALDILTTLGFVSNPGRGYVLERTSDLKKSRPIRLHAIIHTDNDKTEYIDVHEDYMIEGRHRSKRRHRVARINQFCYEVDNDLPLTVGNKMNAHYKSLREAAKVYNRLFTNV